MYPAIEYLPCGDTGITVQFGETIDRQLSQRVVKLGRTIVSAGISGCLDAVPTYRSLLIHYDPLTISQSELIKRVEQLIGTMDENSHEGGNTWHLPVCFDNPEFAPDLAYVADWAGTHSEDIIASITAESLYVYMIGFAPGQPYLGDLPEYLSIPRRVNPIPHTPAGSVVIATGKAVIYPFDNPTGWHVIGRTPVKLFDPKASKPTLLSAGDLVKLDRVSIDEFLVLSNNPAHDVESDLRLIGP